MRSLRAAALLALCFGTVAFLVSLDLAQALRFGGTVGALGLVAFGLAELYERTAGRRR